MQYLQFTFIRIYVLQLISNPPPFPRRLHLRLIELVPRVQ